MIRAYEVPHSSGLSVLELLIALAVAAVIAGAGIPALQDTVRNSRRLAAVNELTGAIWLARNSAAVTGRTVVLCKADQHRTCDDSAGGKRWLVIATDESSDETPRNEEAQRLLRVVETKFSGHISSNRSRFSFRPVPLRSSNGTIRFCDDRGGHHDRAIVISYTGRPRLTRPTTDAARRQCHSG